MSSINCAFFLVILGIIHTILLLIARYTLSDDKKIEYDHVDEKIGINLLISYMVVI